MRAIGAPDEIIKHLKKCRIEDQTVGLIPTMGALHKGHFKLIQKSKSENDVTVVSIFVNPIQFNNQEDLKNYPRDLDKDLIQLEKHNVDFVFTPKEDDLYPSKPKISIDFGKMAEVLEGKFRNQHFEGVGIIVSKLLNIIQPTSAYFGLKDLQQYLLIKHMCKDLNFQSKIIGVETEREPNGLALSSRNRRLSNEGIEIASNLHSGLQIISEGYYNKKDLEELMLLVDNHYQSIEGLEIEYLEAVHANTLESVSSFNDASELAVCVAGYVEGVRLIDNLYLRLK